jgi:hypothetical protein
MATIKHANFAQTTLGAAIESVDGTSITVTSEAGFPAVDFIISIDTEAMLVTNVSTTTWTVTRGYEGSTAATHLNGAAIYHDWSAAEADSTVHGPASAVDTHLAVYDSTTGKLIKDGGACTAAGLALLDDANAAAQLVTLGALPLAGGTMSGDITLGENTAVALDPAGSADEKWSGITVAGTAGATLAVGDLCYLNSEWKWVLADADTAAASGSVALGLCVLAAAGDTSATNMLLLGTMRSAAFPASITGGAQLYVSQTAGDMTTTIPTGADVVVRVVGWAISTEPNTIYFNPSSDYITRVS